MGNKHWANTWTEIEDLGNGKFGATISVGHRVFKDKVDGQYKKHKLTDERPKKDYVLIQSAKCCVEIYPYYAKYFDVNHEEVRLYEERWLVQRLFKAPDTWRDVDAYNPIIKVEEYSEPAGDVVKVTVTYNTDYGELVVEYFQRDGNALKHNITFKNTSGGEETFRVLQRWAGIVGNKCNGKDIPVVEDTPYLAFHDSDKSQKNFNIAENLYSMVFNEDGSEKTDQCLQRPISIETHAQGIKADFIYGNWILAQDEILEIDPDTVTLDNPTEDGYIKRENSTYSRPSASFVRIGMGADYQTRGFIEWDISAIPDGSTITNTIFKYHGDLRYGNADCHIHEMLGTRPSTSSDSSVYSEVGEGTIYASPIGFPVVGENQQVDLGASADSDLQSQLGNNWFAIGIQIDSTATINYSYIWAEEHADATPKPTLYVVYTPPAPAAPTNVQATDGTYTDKVVVTWTKSAGATGYQVYRNGVALGWLGDVATFNDTGADAPIITAGSASASDGTIKEHVALSLSGQSANNGTTHTYKVRAKNAGGESGDSGTNTGYRGVGNLTYQWQRSAGDSDADYSNIDGATTASYNDTGAPADGSGRYYRCVLNATGASQQITNADRGYRKPVQALISTAAISVSTVSTLSRGITEPLTSTANIVSSTTGRLTRIVNLISTSAITISITSILSRGITEVLTSTSAIKTSITATLSRGIKEALNSTVNITISTVSALSRGITQSLVSTANIVLSIVSTLSAKYTFIWIKVKKEITDFTKVEKEESYPTEVGKEKSNWTKIDKEKGDWEKIEKE